MKKHTISLVTRIHEVLQVCEKHYTCNQDISNIINAYHRKYAIAKFEFFIQNNGENGTLV